jgi:hypothetical protein
MLTNDIEIPGFRFDSAEWAQQTEEALITRLRGQGLVGRNDASPPYFSAEALRQVVEAELNEELTEPIARSLVPIESCDPGTQDIVVAGYGRTGGMARPRGKGAMDLPLVDVSGGEMTARQDENWVGCQYTDRDLMAAAKAGRPLERDKMTAAHEDLEDLFDLQLRFGAPALNTTGMLNYHTPTSLTHGHWDDPATTNAEILADVAATVNAFRAGNPKHRMPNTCRWDGDTHARMTAPISGDASLVGTSLLAVLQRTYPYIDFGVWDALDTAGTGVDETTGLGGAPLLILYRKDRMVVRAWESRTPSPDPAEEKFGVFTIPWRQISTQGCLWLRPLEGMTVEDHHS